MPALQQLPAGAAKRGAMLGLALSAALLGGCGEDGETALPDAVVVPPEAAPTVQHPEPPPELGPDLEWSDLMPRGWRPEPPFAAADVADLEDDDPRAVELLATLRGLWSEAPVVEALDGRAVRLTGVVVPLATGSREMREFLLVPYVGGCVHAPPAPANQSVRVVTAADAGYRGELFDSVRVEGTLHVDGFSHPRGTAGYRIDAATVRAPGTTEDQ